MGALWKEEWRLNWTGQPREHWIGAIYDALGPHLYRYALMIVADRALADDVVQQAFVKLLERGSVDGLMSVKAYLHVIVRNEAYHLMARRGSVGGETRDGRVQLLEEAGDTAGQVEERQQVEEALKQLPAEQREVIHLKLWEKLTFAEIGEVLAISQNTAASRYRYAVERLRELLPVPRS